MDVKQLAVPQLAPEVACAVTSSDGYIHNGTIVQDGVSNLRIGQTDVGGGNIIYRGYLFFDTSPLAGFTVVRALLGMIGLANYSVQDFDIVIQNGQPVFPHDPIILADWAAGNYAGDGGSINTVDFTTAWSTYNYIELNADGRSWVNLTGTTKFCLRSSRDIAGIPAAVGVSEWVEIRAQEAGNASVLFVYYE